MGMTNSTSAPESPLGIAISIRPTSRWVSFSFRSVYRWVAPESQRPNPIASGQASQLRKPHEFIPNGNQCKAFSPPDNGSVAAAHDFMQRHAFAPPLGYDGCMFAFFDSPYDWLVIALLTFLFFGNGTPKAFSYLRRCERCGWRSLHSTHCLHCGWPKYGGPCNP
jgi:hypothetical protein